MYTLIELATRETDDAAKRLGQAIRVHDEARQKLTLLNDYRNDYAARFQTSMTAGLSASGYRNFQLFIDKLDSAISGQQVIVATAQTRIDTVRSAWQVSERKRMSYDTLVQREQKQIQRQANHRDQKQSDEHAARALLYKR